MYVAVMISAVIDCCPCLHAHIHRTWKALSAGAYILMSGVAKHFLTFLFRFTLVPSSGMYIFASVQDLFSI